MAREEVEPDRGRRDKRVSRADWLRAALSVLEEGGIQAVRIERIAARLGVAKSGFYYHFRDRADLHEKLLDHWLVLDKGPILSEVEAGKLSPREYLSHIEEAVDATELGRLDAAIRQWARQDARVRRVWRGEMKRRLSLIRSLFSSLGFAGDELEMRARLFVAYQVSEREVFDDMTRSDRTRLRKLRMSLLTRPEQVAPE